MLKVLFYPKNFSSTLQSYFIRFPQHAHLAVYDKFLEEFFTRIQQDEMPTHSLPHDSGEPNSGSDSRLGEMDLENDSVDYIPHRSDGDGSATPDPPTSQGQWT